MVDNSHVIVRLFAKDLVVTTQYKLI